MKAINALFLTLSVAAAMAVAGCKGKAPLPGCLDPGEAELTFSNANGFQVWLAFSNALAVEVNGDRVVLNAWRELDKAAVERCVSLYSPGELARRLDCMRRGTEHGTSIGTSNQLVRAYAIKVRKAEQRKRESALRRELE